MKIVLDADACVGHGRCYALAPQVFGPDELGHCVVLLAEPPPELEEAARRGAAACPEEALTVEG